MDMEEEGELELNRQVDSEDMDSVEGGQEEGKDTESNADIVDVMDTGNEDDEDRGKTQLGLEESDDESTEQVEAEQPNGEKEIPDGKQEVQDGEKGGKKQPRLIPFPLARVKSILKSDPDVSLVSQDSVFLITKATELFVRYLANESFQQTQAGKRKLLQGKDLNFPLRHRDCLMFLEGCLD